MIVWSFAYLLMNHPAVVEPVRGITISCQTYGVEWGRDSFGDELDRLKKMGVNWVSIHPYARIHGDGAVTYRYSADNPPSYLTRPIQMAHQRGMKICIKPHLAYWGSKFSWRGAIQFDNEIDQNRFESTYRAWILTLATLAREADAFIIGTELDATAHQKGFWDDLAAQTRTITPAMLGYAANWDRLDKIEFWTSLDFIGVQAYFPLSTEHHPTLDQLQAGWSRIADQLRVTS